MLPAPEVQVRLLLDTLRSTEETADPTDHGMRRNGEKICDRTQHSFTRPVRRYYHNYPYLYDPLLLLTLKK